MSNGNTPPSNTPPAPYNPDTIELDVTYIVPPTDYEQTKTLLSKLTVDDLGKIIKIAQAFVRIEKS